MLQVVRGDTFDLVSDNFRKTEGELEERTVFQEAVANDLRVKKQEMAWVPQSRLDGRYRVDGRER